MSYEVSNGSHPAHDAYRSAQSMQQRRSLTLTCSTFTHLTLFVTVFLMWIYIFNWPNPAAAATNGWKFSWHPVLMVSGFVLFMGEALLAYRLLPFDHAVQKRIHFVLHSIALMCASIALWAIITYHSDNDIPHFYNIHSILGLMTFVLYTAQWIVGVVTMLRPGKPLFSDATRAALMPYHKYVGMLLFCLCWFSMLTGLMDRERLVFRSDGDEPDEGPEFSPPYRLANAAGCFIVLSGAVLLYHFSPVAGKAYESEEEATQRLLMP
jgi:hypothetical protein